MRKARILLILGIWVAILPYLGFPYAWKDVLFTLTGFSIMYFSYVLYQDAKPKNNGRNFDNFQENLEFVTKKENE